MQKRLEVKSGDYICKKVCNVSYTLESIRGSWIEHKTTEYIIYKIGKKCRGGFRYSKLECGRFRSLGGLAMSVHPKGEWHKCSISRVNKIQRRQLGKHYKFLYSFPSFESRPSIF